MIAGSRDMSGAMTFAAEAAYRMGTGLVKIYTHIDNKEIAGVRIPEAVLMCYSNKDEAEQCARDAVEWSDAILIGPGIGKGDAARSMVEYIMCEAVQTVIADADALNIISEKPDILGRHRGPVIVTPHIGEMTRIPERSATTYVSAIPMTTALRSGKMPMQAVKPVRVLSLMIMECCQSMNTLRVNHWKIAG